MVFSPADVSSAVLMRIGDQVIYHERVFVLLGHEPMSVHRPARRGRDPQTGERFAVPLDELRPAPPEPEGFGPAA